MRRIPLRFCVLSAILIVINIAGLLVIRQELVKDDAPAARPLRLLSALPATDVDSTDRLTLILDAPVARSEELRKPLSKALFAIDPKPAGHWMWAAPNRLDFMLDEPLPAATEFRVTPAANIEVETGKVVQIDNGVVFKTRPLELERCELQSADPRHVNFELEFNQLVAPEVLLRHLKVLDADASAHSSTNTDDRDDSDSSDGLEGAVPVDLHPVSLVKEPSEIIVVRCNRPEGKRLKIVLDGKLTGNAGNLALDKTVTRLLDVSVVFSLLRAAVDQPELDQNIGVRLYFSENLDRQQPVPKVQISPVVENVSFRIHRMPYSKATVLRLEGAFEPGRQYSATVAPTLLSESEKTLGESQTISFDVPDREPLVRFSTGPGVLTPQGNLVVDIKSVNIGGLTLSASRVHANNIVAHLQGQYHRRTSRSLAERTIALNHPQNIPTTDALDLGGLLDEPLGVYRLWASATDHTWTRDSTIVTVTDLALTVKRERQGTCVWVTSLRTAKPVAGAKVSSLSYNNQILATAITADDGTALLEVDNRNPDGAPWVIVAERDVPATSGKSATDNVSSAQTPEATIPGATGRPKDLAYLRIDESPWVLDDVEQSGRVAPTTYDVMLYAERGVYRPGDTIHLTGIIRDALGDVPPTFPLSLSVTRPDGRQVADVAVTPEADKQGMFHLDFPTGVNSQTGPYVFRASVPGSEDVLASSHVYVEAFLPVRIKLDAEPGQQRFGPEDLVTVNVSARYLFGPPAADLPITISGSFRRVAFSSKEHPDFTFGDLSQTDRVEADAIEKTLDAKGRATMELVSPVAKPPGLWAGRFTATVTEPGARSVSANVTLSVDTADRHVGLRIPVGNVVAANEPVDLEWIQRAGDDKAAEPGPIDLTLVRVEYDTVLRRVNGEMAWRSMERATSVWTGATADGADKAHGSLKLNCPAAGKYRVEAVDRRSGSRTRAEFYATDSASTNSSIGMNRPERLDIVLDKDVYVPGETAKVVVKSPFAGTMLLCVEADRVIEKRIIEMERNTVSVDLPVHATLRGGAYLTASVVRAVDPDDSNWLPHRARGMARLVTDHSGHRLSVSIQAPSDAEPGAKIDVVVTTRAPSEGRPAAVIHLWAVDEGILQTSAFTTPDPLDHFLGQRKSEVTTSDVFGNLLPDHKRPVGMTRIGAGAHREIDSLRRNPVPTTHKAPAIIWHTVKPADGSGRMTLTFELPRLTGTMRLMAVAVDRDDYGCAQHAVTLSSPLLVEAAWPRFVAPQDTFHVPVKLFNSTDKPLQIRVTLMATGPLEVTIPEAPVAVLPNEPLTVWLDAKATGIGQATVAIKAAAATSEGGNLEGVSEAALSVRPTGGLHSVSQIAQIKAGHPLTLEVPAEFSQNGLQRTIAISARPSVQLRPAVDQLIAYPYGCVEQTSSQLYALLAASDALGLEPGDTGRRKALKNMIGAGIARLWSLQTPSGGLGYWPGASYPDDWGTAYAARALLEAKRQGHKVDGRFLDELVKYLKSVVSEHASDENRLAQMCRVLAQCGQPQTGWMARLSERLDRLDMEGRADLAAAWHRSGRKDRALEALPNDTIGLAVSTATHGRPTSTIQQEAVLLAVLLEIDPHHTGIPILAQRLIEARKNGTWGNTLENSTAISALARYQALNVAPSEFQGHIKTADRPAVPFTHTSALTAEVSETAAPIEITSSGTGRIYVSVTTRGLLSDGSVEEYDRHLQVRRKWSDRHGRPIDPTSMKVGDLVQVEVTLQSVAARGSKTIHNVAIVDALPGGMEVENPRLATSATADEDQDSEADHVEFLDDRVVLFASAGRRVRKFRYALRVIAAGTFSLPSIQASCMYNEGYASLHGGGTVKITR